MPTLISDKYKNISKKITRDREGYYIMINPPRQHTNPKCIWTKKRAAKYTKQKLTEQKWEIHKSTIITENFNIPLSKTDWTREKIGKDTEKKHY